jgi:uncharacterized protein YndB with AHSA1/START domain
MRKALAVAALLFVFRGGAAAEVSDSSAGGFTLKFYLTVKAPPEEVYKKLVHNVGDWWSSQHTFSGDSHNLSIDAKPMGCFCERLPNGGGVRHMEVVNVAPGKTLVMLGGLGPFQSLATTGSMQIQISPAEGGSKLQVTYAVAGYLPAGTYQPAGISSWADAADAMLKEQLTRLKNYAETGSPQPK